MLGLVAAWASILGFLSSLVSTVRATLSRRRTRGSVNRDKQTELMRWSSTLTVGIKGHALKPLLETCLFVVVIVALTVGTVLVLRGSVLFVGMFEHVGASPLLSEESSGDDWLS